MASTATDGDFERMSKAMRRITDLRLGSNTRLVDGLYYEHRMLPRNKWALSIYRNELTPGNDIEIAIDASSLLWPEDAAPTRMAEIRTWLEQRRAELENLPSQVHAHQVPNAFRIGLRVSNAHTFLEHLVQQFAITDTRKRWQTGQVPATTSSIARSLAPDLAAEPRRPTPPTQNPLVERMLRTVLQTCAQSGSTSRVVLKEKRFLFESEEEFRQLVGHLLEQSGGRCALTNVQLDMLEADSELAPSLDRIDSTRHYEPGNLQIVARFANRWKSDNTDEHFQRLLDLVRSADPGS